MTVLKLVLLTPLLFTSGTHTIRSFDIFWKVYATCDGAADAIGARLCFSVKEMVITSVNFQLINDRSGQTGIAVHLVSVEASPPGLPKGLTSAVSVTYAFFGGPIEYYAGAQVYIVGTKKIDDIASSIFSAIKKRCP